MAFNVAYLSSVGVDQFHNQIWTCYTTDGLTSLDGSGYFNAAADMLAVGDIIFVRKIDSLAKVVTKDYAVSGFGIHVVVSNAAGVVDVTNTLGGVWSDTD